MQFQDREYQWTAWHQSYVRIFGIIHLIQQITGFTKKKHFIIEFEPVWRQYLVCPSHMKFHKNTSKKTARR